MKSSAIFFFILFSICYIANAQKAFDQVRALINNLKASNIKDQQQADAREVKERAWCKREYDRAFKLWQRRKADVEAMKKHIEWLTKTRAEARKDRATRVQRIKNNLALLKKFKKQRCDNNLLFVKSLREHMQAVEIMKLLRKDIVDYFNSKPKGQRGVFLEQFEEFTALLDEEHKQVFAELKNEIANLKPHKLDRNKETNIKTRSDKSINTQGNRLTAHKARTNKQIGKKHIDNKRGALKRLKVPKHEKIAAFNRRVRKKVLGMIDGLIKHLRESRRKLTRDEIQAAEDFAIFHNAMEKENAYLKVTIAKLTKEILSLTNQLNIANVQLKKRISLCNAAEKACQLLKKMCEEKYAYFAKETKRRNQENVSIAQALKLFNRITKSLSSRVRARASSINTSGKLSGKHSMAHRVVKSHPTVNKNLVNRQKSRRAIVF